ncbi:CCR4-Not complex component, Not1-domain-containing protein [Plectosphaerella cucumerina]|uniref:General negative regulator of transcription subunit 1 n=1 Tax=Plectosphaerella cucumerina TaxID=40658 RepID=A0A8K0T642_9PEZI|nr:CCR4-Not complex component, Not1-domain-containing protein [Plectosphaerella cucumerina]
MVPPSRAGSFSPNPAQSLSTATGHTQNPPFGGAFSANASPSTNSPTGSNPLVKIVVAQVYLLLSTIKHDDKTKREAQVDQLRKLLDEHGMEVFSKYFTRLVASCAAQVFGLTRPAPNPGNYHLLAEEMQKISHDLDQAGRIAEAIESGTDDIFRDFDLSTFMEHFKLDALEKTILALAFKMGSKPDLKAKADAILSANFPNFVNIIARPDWENHTDMDDSFVARIVDRFIQYQPPNFNAASKSELNYKVQARWNDQAPPPSEVLAALDMVRILADKPPNALAIYIQRTGVAFTADVESCLNFLQSRPSNVHLTEEQVSVALTYTTISHNPVMDSGVLVMALRRILPSSFRWQDVVAYFDQRSARISSHQFLRLYNALLPVAQADPAAFNIELLWGGNWENPETQLSFICAFASLSPEQLDASTIPGLRPTLTLDAFEHSPPDVKERAAYAVRHPLVSVAALAAVFHVALHSVHASQSAEAKRLFQEVVVPNLDIFVVSAFGVPKPWPPMAMETLNSLFDNFLYKRSDEYDFVLDSLWKKDRGWVTQRLVDAHAVNPTDLPLIYEHAVKHKWLDDLVSLTSGFGLDLAAYAHAQGVVNLAKYARDSTDRTAEVARSLQQFLLIKANLELQYQRPVDGQPIVKSTTLQVRTVAALLQILEDFMPKAPVQDLILVQRSCITVYPRLINYNEGLDDIIDSNGANGNALSPAANSKMEEHYKKMYSDEIQVRNIVDILHRYKHSRDPLDQDVFACMIHGLFDEYAHYVDYPLEALATTAVLFGGIISHKLIADLPLKIGLGMILEAVRDYPPDVSMFKFGLQALMQIFSRLREWPGFCKQLLQVPGLQGTEAWKKAEDVVREHEEELARSRNGTGTITPHGSYLPSDNLANGTSEDARPLDRQPQAFASIRADDPVPDMDSQEPNEDVQGKVQFVLNNLTETTLQSMCQELRDILEQRHKQWFAGHLVEERAKMQPNYHQVYLELVKLFEDKVLWSEVLRETYVSVSRMLNSEVTISNATERGHLKNLGGWLGLLTLARDKPIKHRNIAFKQLLLEAHDTKRLVLVIPFVCKVLIQGASSTVFRPPNPWMMDIIHLLIELYHNAELKLNLKFEIEVLCKGLNLDHKSITPSSEILNRVTAEESAEIIGHDALDTFENLSMNGITAGIPGGLSPQVLPASIPDIKEDIQIPPRTRWSSENRNWRASYIIQPVVDRSVTIAAISTREMIRKDFATEPDETRIRTSAISMVKATAGSLALVTSKEPLRGNFTNYLRNLANDLPQGLPEGTIIMCVNSNLDLACKIIEKQAEERAVPEIEEMIEPELEARRRHRAQRPNEPYVDPSLSRWAWTIPNPFKLSPNVNGLNPEQMAIYEDFARQPRNGPTNSGSHLPSASDATRSIANDVLSDQFSNVPSLPTPAETPTAQHLGSHMASYTPLHSSTVANGRQPGHPIDARALYERSRALLQQLQSNAANAPDEHFADLPRGHIVLEIVDALGQHMIKTSQTSEDVAALVADQIISDMFQSEDALFLECLAQVLETLRRISGPVLNNRVASHFIQQPGASFLRLPLISALLRTDLLDWRGIDSAMSKMLQQKKDGSLEFLEQLLILTIWAARPVVMFSDFSRSLEAAWTWIHEDTTTAVAQRLKQRLSASPSSSASASAVTPQRDQMEYVFEEWVHIHDNPDTSDDYAIQFLRQMQAGGILNSKEDLFLFTRTAIDVAVDKFEQLAHNASSAAEAFRATDALARLVALCIRLQDDDQTTSSTSRTTYVDSILALLTLVLSHHHLRRGEHFNQKVFHRLLSVLFYEIATLLEEAGEDECSATSIKMASRLADLSPRYLPGFAYGWLALIQHRRFLPIIMRDRAGWVAYSKLLRLLFEFVGDQLKLPDPSFVARDAYRATLKLLVVLQHDFPEYLASQASHLILCLPLHCKQLINAILAANPSANLSDPLSTGLQADQIEETRETLTALEKSASVLRDAGLLEILEQALGSGPTEDIVAYITRAMSVASDMDTGFANVPVRANLAVIEAVTSFVGKYGLDQLATTDDAFNDRGPQVQLVIMLLHELMPEPRYYFIAGMVNQLRCPSAWTTYFSRLILQVFGHDMNDPEENEIREQVTRVLMERLIGYWPQPWGLMVTTMELLKNEKYMFFDLPFVKSSPEVVDRFSAIIQRA